MIAFSPWMIALVTGVAAMLLRSGIRRHGRARAIYIALAVAVLLVGSWYMFVKAANQAVNQVSGNVGKDFQTPVFWHGRVTISPSGGLDLDQAPPKRSDSPDIQLVSSTPGQIQGSPGGEGSLAPWNGSRAPYALDCTTQLLGSARLRMTVRSGSTVCLQTASGRIASLTFTSVDGKDGTDTAEATVWAKQ